MLKIKEGEIRNAALVVWAPLRLCEKVPLYDDYAPNKPVANQDDKMFALNGLPRAKKPLECDKNTMPIAMFPMLVKAINQVYRMQL